VNGKRQVMRSIVVGIIALVGLLVGQSDGHPCNAAAIARQDKVQSSFPPTCKAPDERDVNLRVVITQGERPDFVLYDKVVSYWNKAKLEEYISEVKGDWSKCGVGSTFRLVDVSIGGSFTVTGDWNNAGISYTTPSVETITIAQQSTPSEDNHQYQWTHWIKKVKATYFGRTDTYNYLGARTDRNYDPAYNVKNIASGVYYKAQCCQEN
jgi:hypothetical protein